ncbi:serine permease [Francisellaceae bacterium CB299]
MNMQKKSKFDKFDFSWLIISIGMAVGAGIVLVPITTGIVGFVIFAISILVAYPGIYLFQKLYVRTLFASKKPKVYKEVIGELLGERWSFFLGTLYFLMMLIWTVIYAEVVAKSLAAYLYIFKITENPHLEQNIVFSALLMIVLIFIGIKSQKLLVRVSSFLVCALVVAVVLASVFLIPLWSLDNIATLPRENSEFITQTVFMLPFSLTSILFIQSLSPMVSAYRIHYSGFENNELALHKTLKTMKVAFILLVGLIGFYILSFSLVIPKKLALEAAAGNQSAFVLLEQHGLSSVVLHVCGIVISLCAILTSFLSILSGMIESLKGLLKTGLSKFNLYEIIGTKSIDVLVVTIIFLLTWLSIVFDVPIYNLVPLSGPIFGILGCLVPAYMVYKVPSLHVYKSKSVYFIIFIGIVLIISPLLPSAT